MGTTESETAPGADRHARTLEMLEDAIEDLRNKLKQEGKASYSDLVRLVELQKELEEQGGTEAIREIKVTWIEPTDPESGSGE